MTGTGLAKVSRERAVQNVGGSFIWPSLASIQRGIFPVEATTQRLGCLGT